MIEAVHQVLPTYAPRDAVGTHTRHARSVLREMGLRSDIFAAGHAGIRRSEVHDISRLTRALDRGPSAIVYQLSTGSIVGDTVLGRREPKILNYHNVTEARLFAPWEPSVGAELAKGRDQLRLFATASDSGIAVSRYNEAELIEAGFARTSVAPVMFDPDVFDRTVDQKVLGQLLEAKARGGADLLFVGRVSPNKAQHDLVKALAAYRRMYDGSARLHIVGGASSHSYMAALKKYVKTLGLQRAVDITGSVSDGELAARYRVADAFVCVSEHEGFCVPLLEAMHHRIPVVAFAAAAVPETVAGAAVLLLDKSPATVAAGVHRVISDAGLRRALVAAGEARVVGLSLPAAKQAFRTAIEDSLSRL